jgi:hypothetical protein
VTLVKLTIKIAINKGGLMAIEVKENLIIDKDYNGKILTYFAQEDGEIDVFAVALSHSALNDLKKQFSKNIFHWINKDQSLEIYYARESLLLYFKRVDNGQKYELYLNAKDTTRLKNILF